MNKTIWNPGDIITTEKWNKIKNNIEILGAYQLPCLDKGTMLEITMSYNDIISLLKKGVICYFIYDNNVIYYLNSYNDGTLRFFSDGTTKTFLSSDNKMLCDIGPV